LRVFLDTNVLVSAFLGSGLCRDLLRTIADEHDLVVSSLVVEEYQRVLRDKFGASETDLNEALTMIQHAEVVSDASTPTTRGNEPTSDLIIVLTAREATVDVLVTGDRGMMAQALDFNVAAVNPRGFLQIISRLDDSYPTPSADDDGPLVSEPKENPIKEKAFQFALQTVHLYQQLQDQREYVLSKQLLRSGTSIGANVEEATAAESRADFIHKMKIAMKESRETHYWLRLLDQSDLAKNIDLTEALELCNEISRMLTSITKTAIENARR
jgi:four helix bundle protein